MMMAESIRYPIGEQDFRVLRENGYLYVDKTRYIEKIVAGGRYYFLARPRRFGKSLFMSSLKYFFKGYRYLFKGLHIDEFDWPWESYPVLHMDLNPGRYEDVGSLDDMLNSVFRIWEEEYGLPVTETNPSQRFGSIIRNIHLYTGKQVVVLVDEYDKPLVANLNKDSLFDTHRNILASLYSNFKSNAEHIRLVFMTGVSRFSKLSIFSDLNNLNDISFEDNFADICGITGSELETDLREGIHYLAERECIGVGEARCKLQENYDGYRFSRRGNDIYNPWSLLNCLAKGEIRNYWNHTGIPTIVAESLKGMDVDLEKIFNARCSPDTLYGMDIKSPDPRALLYQTGYLTIKRYDPELEMFELGIPNREVKEALFSVSSLLCEGETRFYQRFARGSYHQSQVRGAGEVYEKPSALFCGGALRTQY